MTFDQFCATQEDIIEAFQFGLLTEAQLDREMEQLEEQWQEEGEE